MMNQGRGRCTVVSDSARAMVISSSNTIHSCLQTTPSASACSRPGHEGHDWVNNGSVAAGSMKFFDIPQQKEWRIIIKEECGKMGRLWDRSVQQCRDLRQRDQEDWTVPASHIVPDGFPFARRDQSILCDPLIPGQNRAAVHAALRKGRGFFNLWVAHQNPESDGRADGSSSKIKWKLPAANILHSNETMLKCLLSVMPEPERDRFVQYMGNLPLGFGIISAVSTHFLGFAEFSYSLQRPNLLIIGTPFRKDICLMRRDLVPG
ncbi:hypothetical protein J3F83DRAFT_753902 [Trichoderma novae-zelandiae]